VKLISLQVYTSALALGSLLTTKWRRIVETYIGVLYLAVFIVYVYADAYQLVLVGGLSPSLPALGRLAVLFFLGVFVPLALPGEASSVRYLPC
jgi:hypothetical protein